MIRKSYISGTFATKLGNAGLRRWLTFVMACVLTIPNSLQAQTISVGNAVISIAEGVTLSTDGGIHLENEGAIANEGILEVSGDWINNGNGLLPYGKGKVVFHGKDQQVGGSKPSHFHDLVMEGNGTKDLKVDVRVTGILTLKNCLVLVHQNDFTNPGLNPFTNAWSNAIVVREKETPLSVDAFRIEPASSIPGFAFAGANQASASGVFRTSNKRAKEKRSQTITRLEYPKSSRYLQLLGLQAGIAGCERSGIVNYVIETIYFTRTLDADGDLIDNHSLESVCRICGSQASGNCRLNDIGMTRKLDLGSAPASLFLARESISFYQA